MSVHLNVDRGYLSIVGNGELLATGCLCHDDPIYWWIQSLDGSVIRVSDSELRRRLSDDCRPTLQDVETLFTEHYESF